MPKEEQLKQLIYNLYNDILNLFKTNPVHAIKNTQGECKYMMSSYY